MYKVTLTQIKTIIILHQFLTNNFIIIPFIFIALLS